MEVNKTHHTHSITLPLYEGYVSVRRNITFIYDGNHGQGNTLHTLIKVYEGSDIPHIQ